MSCEVVQVEGQTTVILVDCNQAEVIEVSPLPVEVIEVFNGAGSGGGAADFWEPEAFEALAPGQAAYVLASGQAGLAQASLSARDVIGLCVLAAPPGFGARVQTSGHVTLPDWTAATGFSGLIPGAEYWLASLPAGGIQNFPPAGGGVTYQRIGRAISLNTLVLQIEKYGRK